MSIKNYRSSARFVISPNPDVIEATDWIRSLDTLDRASIITTYAEVFGSDRILREASESLELAEDELAQYRVASVGLPDANILEVSIVGPNPKVAAALVESVSQRSIEYVEDLYLLYDLTLLDPAGVPSQPVSPQPLRDLAIAAVVGLVLGTGLAFVRYDLFDDQIDELLYPPNRVQSPSSSTGTGPPAASGSGSTGSPGKAAPEQ